DQPAADFRSMTRSLIHLLRDPGSDLITMNSLGVWLQEEVTSRSGGLQIPQFGHIAGSEGGNFVFYAPATAAPTDLLPERLREALTDDDARLRYFAIAEAETHISNQDYGPIVISVLESMALDDPARDVRRRALKALRSPPLADDFVHHRTPTTGLEPVSMTDITRPVEKLDKPYLLWKIPGSKTQSAPLTGDSMTIGRDPTCDIVIRHPSVSRLHGLLAQGPTGFMITDKGSTNGTAVNGSLVSGWCELINQDKIQLGQVTVTYIEPDE
ncbi:MAG: FHA domain-containing protein, partial [Anaerolineae bacterium]